MPGLSINQTALLAAIDALALPPDAPGIAVAVLADADLTSTAAGRADPDGRPMTASTPLRIASLTKTFTAAAILRLWETDRLDLDAPVSALISPQHEAMLRAGGYETGAITPRLLLMHAGGLSDHFGSDAFTQAVLADPGRVWTRTGQIASMLAETKPVGRPGEHFRYSDTGYLLLGEIVERVTARPLGQAVRYLCGWDTPRLDGVRWEGEAPTAGPDRAHQWFDGIDTFHIHGSVDAFGGGGIIASVEQTALIYHALFSGVVFEDAATLEEMLSAPGHPEGSPYRMGVFEDRLGDTRVFRHAGFWGLEALIVPGADLVIVVATLDQSRVQGIRNLLDDLASARIGKR